MWKDLCDSENLNPVSLAAMKEQVEPSSAHLHSIRLVNGTLIKAM